MEEIEAFCSVVVQCCEVVRSIYTRVGSYVVLKIYLSRVEVVY